MFGGQQTGPMAYLKDEGEDESDSDSDSDKEAHFMMKRSLDKSVFTPGLVSKRTIRAEDDRVLAHEILDGYKIKSDLDRKLILGVWEDMGIDNQDSSRENQRQHLSLPSAFL